MRGKNLLQDLDAPRWVDEKSVIRIRKAAERCFQKADGKLRLSEASASEEFLVMLAQYYHHKGVADGCSLQQLANILGGKNSPYQPSQMRKFLKLAESKKIIRITITTRPGINDEKIKSAFGLRRIAVAESSDRRGDLLRNLGAKAAEMFDALYREHGALHVAIGGGRTIYAMVEALGTVDRSLTVSPLSFFTRVEPSESDQGAMRDAPFLANAIAWKSRCSANVCAVPPLPEPKGNDYTDARSFSHMLFEKSSALAFALERACDAQAIFVSLSTLSEDNVDIWPTFERVGITEKQLRDAGSVGHLNFTAFNSKGKDVLTQLAKDAGMRSASNSRHPFVPAVSFSTIRSAAKDPNRTVCLVAGGREKFHAIRAALEGRICNALVTDEETVERLLDDADSKSDGA